MGSSIAVKSANQANAVVISNNNMEGQSFAAIVVGNSIGGMIIEGNEVICRCPHAHATLELFTSDLCLLLAI